MKNDMENSMLLNVHQVAGLHGNLFYSNPVESTHFKFKNRIRQKKTDIQLLGCPILTWTYSEAIEVYQVLLTEHVNNIERVILDQAPYKLPDSCKHLSIL